MSHLSWRMLDVKGQNPLGSTRVVTGSSDAPEPLNHRLLVNLLRVGSSGVLWARVHPHGVVTGLQRLDASTKKCLQQIHAGHSAPDQLHNCFNQDRHLTLFMFFYSQRARGTEPLQRKRRKTSRLTRSQNMFAIEPSQLPSLPDLGKVMGGKVLLPLVWIPNPPHIWIPRVLSSVGLAVFTD